MKQKLILTILSLVLLTVFLTCQKDDSPYTEQNIEQRNPTIITISYDQANGVFNDLKAQYNLDSHKATQFAENIQGRTTTDTLGLIIETDIIKQVTHGDYTSYTMKIVDQDSIVFYNLTIEYKNGESDMFITKYMPNDYWLNNKDEVFQGEIQSRRAELTQYTDPEEAFDGGGVGPDPGSVDVGTGPAGTAGTYSSDYPWDCMGTVIVTTELVPYPCGCGHLDIADCSGCGTASPQWPGLEQVTLYACEQSWDNGPEDPDDIGNPGGVNPDPIPDDPKITVTIKPEECTERIEGDLDSDCDVDAIDCQLAGYDDVVCDCVVGTNTLEKCLIINDISNCINGASILDDTTISQDNLNGVSLTIDQWLAANDFLTENGCSEEAQKLAINAIHVLDENSEANPFLGADCRSFEFAMPPGALQRGCGVTNMNLTFYTAGIRPNGSPYYGEIDINTSLVYFTAPTWMTNSQAANATASAVTRAIDLTRLYFYENPDISQQGLANFFNTTLVSQMGLIGGTASPIAPFPIPSPAPFVSNFFGALIDC